MHCRHCGADADLLFACPVCGGLIPEGWEAAYGIWQARANIVEQFQIDDLRNAANITNLATTETAAVRATQDTANAWGASAYLFRLNGDQPRALVAALSPQTD